jgi:hypothetical protein
MHPPEKHDVAKGPNELIKPASLSCEREKATQRDKGERERMKE